MSKLLRVLGCEPGIALTFGADVHFSPAQLKRRSQSRGQRGCTLHAVSLGIRGIQALQGHIIRATPHLAEGLFAAQVRAARRGAFQGQCPAETPLRTAPARR